MNDSDFLKVINKTFKLMIYSKGVNKSLIKKEYSIKHSER